MIRRLIALAAALFCSAAMAYPDKPLRLIVPFPAGDGLDTQGRMIADRLGNTHGTWTEHACLPGGDIFGPPQNRAVLGFDTFVGEIGRAHV